ncbi:hypothetical protein BHE74_00008194 [Ensete ventricosum]|nr:hypothetical protein BHE74_00008194 [Ensete ventricosum]
MILRSFTSRSFSSAPRSHRDELEIAAAPPAIPRRPASKMEETETLVQRRKVSISRTPSRKGKVTRREAPVETRSRDAERLGDEGCLRRQGRRSATE